MKHHIRFYLTNIFAMSLVYLAWLYGGVRYVLETDDYHLSKFIAAATLVAVIHCWLELRKPRPDSWQIFEQRVTRVDHTAGMLVFLGLMGTVVVMGMSDGRDGASPEFHLQPIEPLPPK